MSDEGEAVQLARRALDGSVSAIMACRRLVPLLSRLGVSREDEILEILILIESETDALPLGHERREWSSEVLDSKATEIATAEIWARGMGADAFAGIVNRWAHAEDRTLTGND